MVIPLLSVVIPTFKRPAYLSRAIASALESSLEGSVEVIVVPNGPDNSWKEVMAEFESDLRVKWYPVDDGGGAYARNYGFKHVSGEYIRFLDDDDYLHVEECRSQLELALKHGLDVCSGAIDIDDGSSKFVKRLFQPDTNDVVVAALSPSRMTATHAHIYKRSFLVGVEWDASLPVRQDVVWFMRVSVLKGIKWSAIDYSVGAWVQHYGERVSRGRDPGQQALSHTAELIISLAEGLGSEGRLTEARKIAAADGLWGCIQKGLRYDVAYWRKTAATANILAPSRTPPSKIYSCRMVKSLDPLFVETLLIPARWLYHPLRKLLEGIGINRV
ncbi:glycosyltransferase family 2 protein [Cycloclasticus pugetii]|uniref:glycosyltransferase family 2 protein n=1 Tax=Cycloclasticus pugetii TaxID=34068 RepID=UPI003A914091